MIMINAASPQDFFNFRRLNGKREGDICPALVGISTSSHSSPSLLSFHLERVFEHIPNIMNTVFRPLSGRPLAQYFCPAYNNPRYWSNNLYKSRLQGVRFELKELSYDYLA